MSKILVANTQARPLTVKTLGEDERVSRITFIPGTNEITEEEWKTVQANSQSKKWIKAKMLVKGVLKDEPELPEGFVVDEEESETKPKAAKKKRSKKAS